MTKRTLTLGSLFDGSGGFPFGGILCGIKPLWASEIEPFPIRVTTKRLPGMKHLGDINGIKGSEIEPVDIITFGSPCQDMSIAGRREGLDGERSGLFHEAIRLVKEMRSSTGGEHPRYLVWENVPGAFSSNKGSDFRAVIQEIVNVRYDCKVHVPQPEKWNPSGLILEDGFSLAWRVFDAQYWGVPQRRKRIYLVADLAGGSAGKILFESEGLPGNPQESIFKRKDAAGCAAESPGETGSLHLNEESPILGSEALPSSIALDSHPNDSRLSISETGRCQTLNARMGTGGGNVPLIAELESDSTSLKGRHLFSYGIGRTVFCQAYNSLFSFPIEIEKAQTVLSTGPGAVAVPSFGIDRAAFNQGTNAKFGISVEKEKESAIVARGPNAVAVPHYSSSKASFFTNALKEQTGTLVATDYKDPPIVSGSEDLEYVVRRLTPTECARLQGFPDWWTADLGTENPTDNEIEKWRQIFLNHSRILDGNEKPKTDSQIIKWLKNPNTDAAEYKMWGNGVALPCVLQVLFGIRFYADMENNTDV